ncbi:MAG: carbohydrate porin [Phycisphaeraceae bacterium]
MAIVINGAARSADADPSLIALSPSAGPGPSAATHVFDTSVAAGPLEWEQLTGDWWGARTSLAEVGITFAPFVIVDWSKNVRGGLDTEGSATRELFSFNATIDLTKLLGLPSGKFYVDLHHQAGQNGSDEVGDYQFVGNWDADGLTQISELWFEYEFFDGLVRTKIGKVDANWEFACTELGWEFVHGSASYPATNLVMPTYPDPAASMNVFVYPTDWLSLGFGLYDGALAEGVRTGARGPGTFFGDPADWYLIGEVGFQWAVGEAGLPGRAAVGGWHHTGTFDRFAGGQAKGTSGFHLVVDQMLWLAQPSTDEEPAGLDNPGIGVFVQYDCADPAVMSADHHINAGVTWRGPLPGRQRDLAGVAVSWIHFTDEPAAGLGDSYELAAEVMYKAYVIPSVAVQPYVQYIVNPGGVGLRDAVNLGVRVTVNF